MFEKDTRRDITKVVKSYANVNAKYIADIYNPKVSQCLAYLDANKLFGSSIIQILTSERINKLVEK